MAIPKAAASTAVRGYLSYTVPIACGTISGECCECAPLVPGRYATAITLLNLSPNPVRIFLLVAPTTLAGATAGRWPDMVRLRGPESIEINPANATTIDCCAVSKLLLGAVAPTAASATYGVVTIAASGLLEVSATFTSVGGEGTSPSIDIEFIEPRELRLRELAANSESPGRRSEGPPASNTTAGRKDSRNS